MSSKVQMFVSTLKFTLDLTQTLAPDQWGIQSQSLGGSFPLLFVRTSWGWGALHISLSLASLMLSGGRFEDLGVPGVQPP